MTFFWQTKKRRAQEAAHEQALKIAASYGMTEEYLAARSHGLSPVEALEEWDLMKPEDYKLF